MFIILPDLNVKIITVEVTNNAVAKKKSLKKSRLVGIRALTSAIPVRGSNQPTGSIKFLYPVVKIFEIHIFIISLPGLLQKYIFNTHCKERRRWFFPFSTWNIKWSSPAKSNQGFALFTEQQENWQGLVTVKIFRDVEVVVDSCEI